MVMAILCVALGRGNGYAKGRGDEMMRGNEGCALGIAMGKTAI